MEFLEFSSDALFPTLSSDLLQQQIAILENERPQEVENEDQPSAPDNVSLAGSNVPRTNQAIFNPTTSQDEDRNWIPRSLETSYVNATTFQQVDSDRLVNPDAIQNNQMSHQQQQFQYRQETVNTIPRMPEVIAPFAASNSAWIPHSSASATASTVPSLRETRISRSARVQQQPYLTQGVRIASGMTTPNSMPNTVNSGQTITRRDDDRDYSFDFTDSWPGPIFTPQQQGETSATPPTSMSQIDVANSTNSNWYSTTPTPRQSSFGSPGGLSRMTSQDRTDTPVNSGVSNPATEVSSYWNRHLPTNSNTSFNTIRRRQQQAATYFRHSLMQNQMQRSKFTRDPSLIMNNNVAPPMVMSGGSSSSTVQSPSSDSSMPTPRRMQLMDQFHQLLANGTATSSSTDNGTTSTVPYPNFPETIGTLATSRNSSGPSIYLPLSQGSMMSNGNRYELKERINLPGVDDGGRGPEFCAALQLAAARQLLLQAAASATAAGVTCFSQSLTDSTLNLDRVMSTYCPSFLQGGRSQMKAFLSLTSSANSQSSAPCIPTCSICLDKLVSTIVFPCRHFFCETCAPKIDKCGLCREIIEDRHRVYF